MYQMNGKRYIITYEELLNLTFLGLIHKGSSGRWDMLCAWNNTNVYQFLFAERDHLVQEFGEFL
jgi:hypothetical protein